MSATACLECRVQLMAPTTSAAYDVNGDFLYYPKDMVEPKRDLYFPPKITGADFSKFSMTRTHAWINSLSRGVIGQDGQGLLLMLHGNAAETTAVGLAGAYAVRRGRPQRTFSVKRLSTISSELNSLREAISSNAVITIHKVMSSYDILMCVHSNVCF